MERKEVSENIKALQSARAKQFTYNDVIALVAKYESTLRRKLSDANKKVERLERSGASQTSDGYNTALNDEMVLQYQIIEATQIRIDLLEKQVEVTAEVDKVSKAFTEMVKRVDEEGIE